MWKRLSHPNVLPTLGAGPDIAKLCVVSPWMPDGTLLQYLKRYPGANRPSVVSARVVHVSGYTKYCTQDGRSRKRAILPPFQGGRSWGLEGGQLYR